MRNIGILLKNSFLSGIGTFTGKKSRLKSSVGFLLILLLYAGIFSLLLVMQLFTAQAYAEMGQTAAILFSGYTMGAFITILMAMQKITGGQKINDAELLLSMPLRKSEIVTAKAVSSYCFNLLLLSIFALPSIIAYMVYTPFSFAALMGNALIILLFPLIGVGITQIVDYFVMRCVPGSHKYSNIFKAIFALIALFGFVVIYEVAIFNAEEFGSFINFVIEFNPLFVFPFLAVTLVIGSLGIFLFSLSLLSENKVSKSHLAMNQNMKTVTPFRALLNNEINRYINSTTLMINTLLGPIVIIAITIWMMINPGTEFLNMLTMIGTLLNLPNPADCIFLAIAFFFSGMVAMTYTATVSISLEGKQFWILKSIPVKTNLILLAKAWFNVMLVSPVVIVGGTIISIVLHPSILYILMMILLPVLMNLIISFGGVLLNLLFPKLEFDNDASVIKNSLSSTIAMLGGFFLSALLLGGYYGLLCTSLPFWLIVLIPIISLAVIAAVIIVLTFTVGRRIFDKL